MRYITAPQDITLDVSMPGGPPATDVVTFSKYAIMYWLDDDRGIAGGFSQQCRWAKVFDAFASLKAHGVIALEDDDYKILREIVEQPKLRPIPRFAVKLIPFSEAVLNAPNTAPSTSS